MKSVQVQVWSTGLEEWEDVPGESWICLLGTIGRPHLTALYNKRHGEDIWQVCRDHLGRYIRIKQVQASVEVGDCR